MAEVLTILPAIDPVHALKFGFFFVLSYRNRHNAPDCAYAGKARAAKIADAVLRLFAIVLVGLLDIRGVDHVSFLTGLLAGVTLMQVYFHQFSVPLSRDEAPDPPSLPIKIMSYAIQSRPTRPWKELVVIASLPVRSLHGLAQQYGLLR